MHSATVERKKVPYNSKKPSTEPGSVGEASAKGNRGFKGRDTGIQKVMVNWLQRFHYLGKC